PGLEFLDLARIERFGGKLVLDMLVLHLAHLAVGLGDAVEGFHHLRLEFGFHGREREVVLVLVVLVLFLLGAAFLVVGGLGGASATGGFGIVLVILLASAGGGRLGHLGVRPGIGGFEVDDVAQQDLAFGELVAPDDNGLEGQRALAQPRDHGFAAGLDALGD